MCGDPCSLLRAPADASRLEAASMQHLLLETLGLLVDECGDVRDPRLHVGERILGEILPLRMTQRALHRGQLVLHLLDRAPQPRQRFSGLGFDGHARLCFQSVVNGSSITRACGPSTLPTATSPGNSNSRRAYPRPITCPSFGDTHALVMRPTSFPSALKMGVLCAGGAVSPSSNPRSVRFTWPRCKIRMIT